MKGSILDFFLWGSQKIAGNHSIESQDFEYPPFIQNGGLGGFYEMFGDQYAEIIETLNSHLVA